MTDETTALMIVVWIPLLVVWVIVLVDLIRQTSMSTRSRWLWAIACTLVWPAMIVYLLMRPTRGRLETAEARTDPRARLVDAALAREAGRLDEAAWSVTVTGLRSR